MEEPISIELVNENVEEQITLSSEESLERLDFSLEEYQPVPVTSVNGKKGKVELTTEDIPNTSNYQNKPEVDANIKSKIDEHNSSSSAHPYLQDKINASSQRINSLATELDNKQNKITPQNKLNSDLVSDANQVNKFVTSAEKTTWNNKSNFSGDYDDLTDKPTITYVEGVPNSSKVVELTNVTETIVGNKNIEDYGVPKFMPIDLSVYDTTTRNKQLKPYTQLPDGNYVVTSGGAIYFAGAGSYFAEEGTFIFKFDGYEVTLIGPDGPALYLYDEDNNEWTGGGFTTSDDVDIAIEMAMPLISNYKSVGVKTPDDFDTGLYIINMSSGAMSPLTLSLNVEGTTQTYTPIENGTLIIKTKNNNFHVIGTEALFFEYDSTNSYYKKPVDLLNTDFVKTSDLTDYVKKDGGSAQQTISLTGGTGTTALGLKSMSTSSYLSMSGTNGWLASIGITSDKKPTVYDGTNHIIAYTSDVPKIFYGTSSTGASTAAKVVTCTEFTSSDLVAGTRISVLFTNANSFNGQATLNINGTGAKNIYYNGTTTNARYMWVAGETVEFIYNGTQWATINGGLATTSYYGVTKLATSASSDSQVYALTPRSLYYFANYSIAPYYSASATYAVGDKVRSSYYLYECKTAIETPEAWNADHWQQIDTLQEQIDALRAEIAALRNSLQ